MFTSAYKKHTVLCFTALASFLSVGVTSSGDETEKKWSDRTINLKQRYLNYKKCYVCPHLDCVSQRYFSRDEARLIREILFQGEAKQHTLQCPNGHSLKRNDNKKIPYLPGRGWILCFRLKCTGCGYKYSLRGEKKGYRIKIPSEGDKCWKKSGCHGTLIDDDVRNIYKHWICTNCKRCYTKPEAKIVQKLKYKNGDVKCLCGSELIRNNGTKKRAIRGVKNIFSLKKFSKKWYCTNVTCHQRFNKGKVKKANEGALSNGSFQDYKDQKFKCPDCSRKSVVNYLHEEYKPKNRRLLAAAKRAGAISVSEHLLRRHE